jgi:hypothetical protein
MLAEMGDFEQALRLTAYCVLTTIVKRNTRGNMFHKLNGRIIALVSIIGITVGIPLGGVGSPAYAYNGGASLCYHDSAGYDCLNAWGGGPWVYVDTNPDLANDAFFVGAVGTGNNVVIQYVGSGSWSGDCIGDAYNDQYNAETSLDACPNQEDDGGGWGTNFQSVGCTDAYGKPGRAFYNNHWQGYLEPEADQNGVHFFLDSGTHYCYVAVDSF